MSNPEFGRKMTCTACAVRFYDLARIPAICPKCGVEQPRAKPRVAAVARPGVVRWSNRPVPPTFEAVAAAPEPTPIETDPLEEVEEEEEEEIEDIELADDEDAALKVKHDD